MCNASHTCKQSLSERPTYVIFFIKSIKLRTLLKYDKICSNLKKKLDLHAQGFFLAKHKQKRYVFLLTSPRTSSFAPSCNPALVGIEGVALVGQVDGLYSGREGDRSVQFDQSNVVRIWAVVLETWVLFKA